MMRLFALVMVFGAACGPQEETFTIMLPAVALGQTTGLGAAQSFTLWILDQVGTDKSAVQCLALLDHSLDPGDARVKKLLDPISGAYSGQAITVKNVPTGKENRVFYLELYDKPDELGARVAEGCAQSVSVVGGRLNEVVIQAQ